MLLSYVHFVINAYMASVLQAENVKNPKLHAKTELSARPRESRKRDTLCAAQMVRDPMLMDTLISINVDVQGACMARSCTTQQVGMHL